MEKKFAELEADFRAKMSELRLCLEKNDDLALLMRWIMSDEANPFDYLPSDLAASVHTCEGMYRLFRLIGHALIDDGDITFLLVNNKPCISFRDKDEALQHYDADYKTATYSKMRTGEVLGRDVAVFVELLRAKSIQNLAVEFTTEIMLFGIDIATENCSAFPNFGEVDVEACVAAAQKNLNRLKWE